MSKVKKLLPQDKYLRMTVIFFVLGMIVRLAVFVLGDISLLSADTYERSEDMLGLLAASLAVGNAVIVFALVFALSWIVRLTSIGVTTLAVIIAVQIINIVLDCLFIKAVYKLDKRFRPVISMLSTLYMLSYIIGLVLGLIFLQVPFNLLTLIAAVIFYKHKVPEDMDEKND